MREIKFRAWDKATQGHWQPKPKGMIEFCLHNVPDYIGHTFNENGGVWERRFTVMQYTGLKDKNGVEIYEGDIVKVFGDVSRVYYSEANACFKYQHEKSPYEVENLGHYSSPAFEVIGNIHENPELSEAN